MPVDGGEAVFEADVEGLVDEELEPYESQIVEVFEPEKGAKNNPTRVGRSPHLKRLCVIWLPIVTSL